MNTETKQPAAGEYWEWDRVAERVRIIANDDGDIVYRNRRQEIRTWLRECSDSFVDLFRHLPDCDSFDWKETVYPRYAVPTKDSDCLFSHCSYFIDESVDSMWNGIRVNGDPQICMFSSMHLAAGAWKLVSREEAEARHERLHREWVIPQLVIINRGKWPDHVPRPGIDWITANDVRGCIPIKSGNQPKNSELGCCFKIYCLPKDLPPEPVPASPPATSYRLVDLHVFVSGLEFFLYRLPVYMAGDIKVEATLILEDHTKYPTISMNLTDGVEEAF